MREYSLRVYERSSSVRIHGLRFVLRDRQTVGGDNKTDVEGDTGVEAETVAGTSCDGGRRHSWSECSQRREHMGSHLLPKLSQPACETASDCVLGVRGDAGRWVRSRCRIPYLIGIPRDDGAASGD